MRLIKCLKKFEIYFFLIKIYPLHAGLYLFCYKLFSSKYVTLKCMPLLKSKCLKSDFCGGLLDGQPDGHAPCCTAQHFGLHQDTQSQGLCSGQGIYLLEGTARYAGLIQTNLDCFCNWLKCFFAFLEKSKTIIYFSSLLTF